MTRIIMAAAAAVVLSATASPAQTARESFSYSTPSGMFGDGMFKWNMYRFMHEDAERMRSGGAETTGSIGGSATSPDTARRPDEFGARRGGSATESVRRSRPATSAGGPLSR